MGSRYSYSCDIVLDPGDIDAKFRDAWPKAFELALKVIISADTLEMYLHVSNASPTSEPLHFQALLHTYYNVPDSSQVRVSDLSGLKFWDKTKSSWETEDHNSTGTGGVATDRVYMEAPDSVRIAYSEASAASNKPEISLKKVELPNIGKLERGVLIPNVLPIETSGSVLEPWFGR